MFRGQPDIKSFQVCLLIRPHPESRSVGFFGSLSMGRLPALSLFHTYVQNHVFFCLFPNASVVPRFIPQMVSPSLVCFQWDALFPKGSVVGFVPELPTSGLPALPHDSGPPPPSVEHPAVRCAGMLKQLKHVKRGFKGGCIGLSHGRSPKKRIHMNPPGAFFNCSVDCSCFMQPPLLLHSYVRCLVHGGVMEVKVRDAHALALQPADEIRDRREEPGCLPSTATWACLFRVLPRNLRFAQGRYNQGP